jgi:ankyrin repeat protein
LHIACQEANVEMMDLLLSLPSVDPNLRCWRLEAESHGEFLDKRYAREKESYPAFWAVDVTPIFFAILSGNEQAISFMIQSDHVDINAVKFRYEIPYGKFTKAIYTNPVPQASVSDHNKNEIRSQRINQKIYHD